MNFKAGDKVIILSGIDIQDYCFGWSPSMENFVGEVCTLVEYDVDNNRESSGWTTKEHGYHYCFDERCIVLVEDIEIKEDFDNRMNEFFCM